MHLTTVCWEMALGVTKLGSYWVVLTDAEKLENERIKSRNYIR